MDKCDSCGIPFNDADMILTMAGYDVHANTGCCWKNFKHFDKQKRFGHQTPHRYKPLPEVKSKWQQILTILRGK